MVPHAGNAFGPLSRRPTTRPSCDEAGVIRWRDGWPGCSRPTPGSVRSCWSTGSTATRKTSTSTCAWQPELWRALVERIEADPPHIRHQKTVARLREGPSDLPQRLSLFGHTRLACTDIELLDALSTHHDLHLWLPHPSDALWRALAGTHGACPAATTPADALPSTRCWTRWAAICVSCNAHCRPTPATDEYIGAAAENAKPYWAGCSPTLPPTRVRPQGRTLTETDRSVQVHSCHGPARQIDVLREVLLGLLADDPTLEPRDIVVMCPDIETYAPLIVADFGLGELAGDTHPAHRLRVKLADRALTQTNQLLGVAAELLAIAGSRVTASQVLNLAQAAPVRARFGFTDDHLDTITDWVRESNIRWGFDAAAPPAIRARSHPAQHLAIRGRPHPDRSGDVG